MVVNGVVLASVLGGGLLLWLLLRLIRYWLRLGRVETLSEGDAGIQARERSALLGAMFGFPAGLWIYDKLYPYSGRSAGGLD